MRELALTRLCLRRMRTDGTLFGLAERLKSVLRRRRTWQTVAGGCQDGDTARCGETAPPDVPVGQPQARGARPYKEVNCAHNYSSPPHCFVSPSFLSPPLSLASTRLHSSSAATTTPRIPYPIIMPFTPDSELELLFPTDQIPTEVRKALPADLHVCLNVATVCSPLSCGL